MTAAGDGVTPPASLGGSGSTAQVARGRAPEFFGPTLDAGNRWSNTPWRPRRDDDPEHPAQSPESCVLRGRGCGQPPNGCSQTLDLRVLDISLRVLDIEASFSCGYERNQFALHLHAKHSMQGFHGGKHLRSVTAAASQETRQSSCPPVLWRSQAEGGGGRCSVTGSRPGRADPAGRLKPGCANRFGCRKSRSRVAPHWP